METSMFDALLGCLRSIDVAAKAIETVLSDSRCVRPRSDRYDRG
jgi:hypothetical protein